MIQRMVTITPVLLLLFLISVPFTYGVEENTTQDNFDSVEALIEILKEKGLFSDEEAAGFIQRHRTEGTIKRPKKNVITIVPEVKEKEYMERITQEVSKKIRGEVKDVQDEQDYMSDELLRRSRLTNYRIDELQRKMDEEVSNKLYSSSWAQRIRWGGDIRLRYQQDRFGENNADLLKPDDPSELMNTQTDRDRFRYRVRLSLQANIIDKTEINVGKVDAGVRLATGNDNDPISTNDTFGDTYNKDTILLDRAYIRWKYSPELPILGAIPQISFMGGRMANPFFHTDLVWDSDLNLEGIAVNFKTDTLMSNPWQGFFTAGSFPLQEVELSQEDKWLDAIQIGLQYKKPMGLSAKLGVAYYNFKFLEGQANDPAYPELLDYTAPGFQQKGNTLFDIDPSSTIKTALASDYNLLNITGTVGFDYWFPIHIILSGDYVENLGFDSTSVAKLTGTQVEEETTGYRMGLTVGYPDIQAFGEWNLSLNYKKLEGDAVLDAFTDSDFHLGGTNAKGWILGGEYGLYKGLWLNVRWITTDEIKGPPLAIDVLQFDINAEF